MVHKKRKIAAVLLALTMATSLLPTAVFAADDTMTGNPQVEVNLSTESESAVDENAGAETPAQPTEQTDTETPAQPAAQTGTETPAQPAEETGTETPTQPTEQTGTETSAQPAEETGTETPTQPAEVPASLPAAPSFPEIYREKTFAGITVKVDAPEGVFPDGAYVEITPVLAKDVMDSIDGVDDPNTIAAFDITFYSRDDQELQPADGKTVDVRFDVAPVSSLAQDDATLQVYHVDDQQNATPVGDEVASSSQGAEVAVEAESFSVYVVTISTPENGNFLNATSIDAKAGETVTLFGKIGTWRGWNNSILCVGYDHQWTVVGDDAQLCEFGKAVLSCNASIKFTNNTPGEAKTFQIEHTWKTELLGSKAVDSETFTVNVSSDVTYAGSIEIVGAPGDYSDTTFTKNTANGDKATLTAASAINAVWFFDDANAKNDNANGITVVPGEIKAYKMANDWGHGTFLKWGFDIGDKGNWQKTIYIDAGPKAIGNTYTLVYQHWDNNIVDQKQTACEYYQVKVVSPYTVTYNSNNGNAVTSAGAAWDGSNYVAEKPADPTMEGFMFMGWLDSEGNVYDFNTPVTEDLTLTAHWGVSVTFNTDGGSSVPMQTIEQNTTAAKPADPSKDASRFLGWFTADGTEYDFNTKVTKNITLKAKWEILNAEFYILNKINEIPLEDGTTQYSSGNYTARDRLNMMGKVNGTAHADKITGNISELNVSEIFKNVNDKIVIKPTAEYLENLKAEILKKNSITENLSNYAVLWYVVKVSGCYHVDGVVYDTTARLVKFSYDANAGDATVVNLPSAVAVKINTNTTVSASVPTLDGYVFTGWNTAADGTGTAYASGAEIGVQGEAVTLYAQWKENPPTPATHTLIIHYVYATGGIAAEDNKVTKTVGEAYSVLSPSLSGYTADKSEVSGTMGNEDGVVTVTYTATPVTPVIPVTPVTPVNDNDDGDDDNTPTKIPDNTTPLAGSPVAAKPTAEISDGETPLTDVPGDTETEIPDETTPLAQAPKTGDCAAVWFGIAAVSGAGLVWLVLSGKRRKNDDAQ